MTRHVPDYYMDGHIAIPFCKVCSAEGDKLLEECTGPIQPVFYFQDMTKEEFEKKFPRASKALDDYYDKD